MGFNSVYQTLQELFPQLDARVLKAVAIENSKDLDAAVGSILIEVLPHLSQQPCIVRGLDERPQNRSPDGEGVAQSISSPEDNNQATILDMTSESSTMSESIVREDANDSNLVNGHDNIHPACSDVTTDDIIASAFYDASDSGDQFSVNTATEELILSGEGMTVKASTGKDSEDIIVNFSSSTSTIVEDGDTAAHQQRSCLDGGPFVEDRVFNGLDASLDQGAPVTASTVSVEDEPFSNAVVTRSGQFCKIDLLEDIIEHAKHHKKTLLLEVESIINLFREVETEEKSAQQAKEAAARGCMEIHSKVEELKKMLIHAKEANDMHAGEVYGEKAILATEARELQSRLLVLSDEREKSLPILDEMRQSLEARMAAAEEERKEAEREKLEKEESARRALSEQELVMEKVVAESKMLQQEAEENAKLREFLMDRGRVVDTLQGEISLICQDVKLMKERFDQHLSLGNSLSNSTSRVLASSTSSSSKTVSSDRVSDQDEPSELLKRISRASSMDGRTPSGVGEKRAEGAGKELSDEDWEIFNF